MLMRLVKESLVRRVYGRVVLWVVDDVREHPSRVKPIVFGESLHNRRATCSSYYCFRCWVVRRMHTT